MSGLSASGARRPLRTRVFAGLAPAAVLFFGLPAALAAVPRAESSDDLKTAFRLNESAVQKMKARDLDGAEADLLRAIEYARDNAKLKKNLAAVYYEKGVRALSEGQKIHEAKRYLDLALSEEPANARYRKAYASALFTEAGLRAREGRDEAALEGYRRVAAFDPGNARAWTEAGYYAWKTQKIALALDCLEKARALDPGDENVRRLAEKLDRSKKEEGLERTESEHFILAASPEFVNELGSQKILDSLERAFADVSAKLSYYPREKIAVVFLPAGQFHSDWRLPARVSGLYDGKLRLPYIKGEELAAQMSPMVRHELAHAFLHSMNGSGSVPAWLSEGIAQWAEGRRLSAKQADTLVVYEITRRLPPIDKLDGVLMHQKNAFNNSEMTLAYMKSLSVTEYLIEQFGVWSIIQLVRDGSRRGAFEAAFIATFHAPTAEINERWRRWLERKKR